MPNLRQAMMGAAGVSTETVGELWAWGRNNKGQCGDGTTTERSSPVQIGSLTDWLSPCTGPNADWGSCVKTDGTFWTWGSNNNGQIAQGDTTDRCSPTQVGSLTNWFQSGGGDYHGIAIKTDGTAWSWGKASNGQTGQNNTTDISSPVQIGSLTDWKGVTADQLAEGYPTRLAVGSYNGWVIKDDGTLWGWGWGVLSQGGWGDTDDRSSPVQIGSGTDWNSICQAPGYNLVATKTDGTLWAWGTNGDGQLGQGDTTSRDSPVQVGSLTTWKYVSVGGGSVHCVKTDGTLWAWGSNNYGQLGLGDTTNYSSPVQVGSLTTWAQVNNNMEGGRMVKQDGTLWVCGRNNQGELGLGNLTDISSPAQVGTYKAWSKLWGGKELTVILK